MLSVGQCCHLLIAMKSNKKFEESMAQGRADNEIDMLVSKPPVPNLEGVDNIIRNLTIRLTYSAM